MNRRFSILAAVAAVVAVGCIGRVDDASAEELLPPRIIAANATDPAIDFVARRGPYSRSQVEKPWFRRSSWTGATGTWAASAVFRFASVTSGRTV